MGADGPRGWAPEQVTGAAATVTGVAAARIAEVAGPAQLGQLAPLTQPAGDIPCRLNRAPAPRRSASPSGAAERGELTAQRTQMRLLPRDRRSQLLDLDPVARVA